MMYTSTDSCACGIQQQRFRDEDRSQFDGILAQGLFNLKFYGIGADAGDRGVSTDWERDRFPWSWSGHGDDAP